LAGAYRCGGFAAGNMVGWWAGNIDWHSAANASSVTLSADVGS